MRRPLALVLVLAGAASCSYIFELPRQNVSATEPDGSTVTDATTSDVTITVGDGTAPTDAPADAPPRFCAAQASALYCGDFDDEPPPTPDQIGTVESSGGGTLLVTNTSALSPPRALRINAGGLGSTALVTHPLNASPTSVTLAFDLLVADWQVTLGELTSIQTNEGLARCNIRLEGTGATWRLVQVCEENQVESERLTTETTSAISPGSWHHFVLKVTFAPTTSVSLDIDNVHTEAAGISPLTQAPTSVVLGARLGSTGTVTLYEDNVVVTTP